MSSLAISAPRETRFQSPCLGTLFARDTFKTDELAEKLLSIPMLGDSFCKPVDFLRLPGVPLDSFQSPCLGTLFARRVRPVYEYERSEPFQSPCLGTLFASW